MQDWQFYMKKLIEILTKKHREVLCLLLCIVVYFIVTSLFDITCIIKYLSGISCPGCGMTRAVKSLIFFDFSKAFYYHPLVFLLLPIAAAFFVVRKNTKARNILIYIVAVIFLLVYFYRLFFTDTSIVVADISSGLFARIFSLLF